MPHSLDQLFDEPESQELEKKSSLDPSNPKEMLGLVADVLAMSNTKGGRLLIGTRGAPIPDNQVKLFDKCAHRRQSELFRRTKCDWNQVYST